MLSHVQIFVIVAIAAKASLAQALLQSTSIQLPDNASPKMPDSSARQPGRNIAAGAAYVGSGYDILNAHPFADSAEAGGIDPGLRPTKYIFQKTFTAGSYCPAEATCVDLSGSAQVHTAKVYMDMIDYQTGLNNSWGAGFSADFSSNGNVSKYLSSFGGSLSKGYKDMQRKIESELKVFVDNQTVTNYAAASFNYGSKGFLSAEFLSHLCELPEAYTQAPYLALIRDWGTHVILSTKIGVRTTVQSLYTGKNTTEFLHSSQADCVASDGSFLSFFIGNIKRDFSATTTSLITANVFSEEVRIVTSGSPEHPMPLSLTLGLISDFIRPKYVKKETIDSLSHVNCARLRDATSLCKIRANMERALVEYPLVDKAHQPEPIWRNYTITPTAPVLWPITTFSMLALRSGCPGLYSGRWATGKRHSGLDGPGWASSGFDSVVAVYASDYIELNFCTKTQTDGGGGSWPAGSYCLFQYGGCPSGFTTGYFENDDNDAWTPWGSGSSYSIGTVPDHGGANSHTITRFEFCCRSDASPNTPISMPLTPFVLLPTAVHRQCQSVRGMFAMMHQVVWIAENNYNNVVKGIFTKQDGKSWTMYFCYYSVGLQKATADKPSVCSADPSNGRYTGVANSNSIFHSFLETTKLKPAARKGNDSDFLDANHAHQLESCKVDIGQPGEHTSIDCATCGVNLIVASLPLLLMLILIYILNH